MPPQRLSPTAYQMGKECPLVTSSLLSSHHVHTLPSTLVASSPSECCLAVKPQSLCCLTNLRVTMSWTSAWTRSPLEKVRVHNVGGYIVFGLLFVHCCDKIMLACVPWQNCTNDRCTTSPSRRRKTTAKTMKIRDQR